jgi:hypothetical protein
MSNIEENLEESRNQELSIYEEGLITDVLPINMVLPTEEVEKEEQQKVSSSVSFSILSNLSENIDENLRDQNNKEELSNKEESPLGISSSPKNPTKLLLEASKKNVETNVSTLSLTCDKSSEEDKTEIEDENKTSNDSNRQQNVEIIEISDDEEDEQDSLSVMKKRKAEREDSVGKRVKRSTEFSDSSNSRSSEHGDSINSSSNEEDEFEEILKTGREMIARMRAPTPTKNTQDQPTESLNPPSHNDEDRMSEPHVQDIIASRNVDSIEEASTSHHKTKENLLLAELIEASNELGRSIQISIEKKAHMDKIIKSMIEEKEKQC